MTLTAPSPVGQRFDSLLGGPWLGEGERVAYELRPPQRLASRTGASSRPLDLAALSLPVDGRRVRHLSDALRFQPHERVPESWFDLRSSMDQALSFLQLVELAIATGYLTAEEVREDVRERFYHTLWAEPAREYVERCGFVGVRMLAARVDVELGLPPISPPAPVANAAIRFAGMLTELRLWYEEGPLDVWLDVLDDFTLPEIDKGALEAELSRRRPVSHDPTAIIALIGADMFVSRLANLFTTMSGAERPLYGIFFSYWLANFFRSDLKSGRFRESLFAPDWPGLLVRSRLLTDRRRAELKGEIDILDAAWRATVSVIEKLTVNPARGASKHGVEDSSAPAKPSWYQRDDAPAAARPVEDRTPKHVRKAPGQAAPAADPQIEDSPRRQGWWSRGFGS